MIHSYMMQVRTILSQNTTDVNSHRAFASLKEAHPTWQSVLEAPPGASSHMVGRSTSWHPLFSSSGMPCGACLWIF